MIDQLPPDVVPYKRTSVFDETTVPAALQKRHNTKAGVWGLIHILEGRLLFRHIDPPSEFVVDATSPKIVIEPKSLHEVQLIGPVRFFIEFHSVPAPKA